MKASALLLPCILAVAGCAYTDPLLRAGLWRPNDSNTANLRAMVAVPADLAVAAPSDGGSGQQAAAALDRLRRDRARPLPDSAIAKVGPTGGSPPPQGTDNN
jgi:hypothetical protein